MKALFIIAVLASSVSTSHAQAKQEIDSLSNRNKKDTLVVEAACGQCKLGLPGESCDLAIRLNGKAYFVDGSDIDSHGDAHAKDGFCNAIRKANVQGRVVDNRFKATYFQLLPEPAKKQKSN